MTKLKLPIKPFFSFLIFVAFFFLAQSSVSAATYYVAATGGSNSYDGLYPDHSQGGIHGPFLTISKSTTVMVAGDTVQVRTGTYNEYVELYLGSSGTAGNYITYMAYPSETPIMDGGGLGSHPAFASGVYSATNAIRNYIIIDGFEVRNYANAGISFRVDQAAAVGSHGSNNIIIRNNIVHNNTAEGIVMEGGDPTVGGDSNNFVVTHNTVYANANHNIKLATNDPVCRLGNSEISYNTAYGSTGGVNAGSGIATSQGFHDSTISHNTTYSNGADGIHVNKSYNTIIEFNESYGNGVVAGSQGHGIWVLTSSNSIVRSNKIYSNVANGILIDAHLTTDTTVNRIYNNLIYSNGTTSGAFYAGIRFQNATQADLVYNNVLYNNHDYGIYVGGSPTVPNIPINDNIFYSVGAGRAADYLIYIANYGAGWSANKIDYNVYYTTDLTSLGWWNGSQNTFTAWKTASSQDSHSINIDPLFVNPAGNDYHLQSSSPAIKAGVNVGVTTDYAGLLRPFSTTPDMGAYEYLAAPAAPSSLTQYRSDGTSVISSGGGVGNNSSVVLKFSMSSTNASDTLTPRIEIQRQGTAFTNTVTNTGTAVAYTGTPVIGTVTLPAMGGGNYHWQANILNASGDSAWTSMGSDPDFFVEFTLSSAPSCGASAGGVPNLFEIRTNKNSATLFFAPPNAPFSSFYIAYSRKPDVWEYGTEFNQAYSGGAISHTINLLQPNTRYYFKVRSGNGCASGGWGNTMTAATSSSKNYAAYYKNTKVKIGNPIPTSKTKTTTSIQTVTPTLKPTLTPTQQPTIPVQTQPAPKPKHCLWFICW